MFDLFETPVSNDPYIRCDRIKTETGLDDALGGGWPCGYICEIYGEESHGKTTLSLLSVAALQRQDPYAIVIFIDCQHSLDGRWAKQCGVDLNRLVVTEPDVAKITLAATLDILETGRVKMLVIDDIYALNFNYAMDDLDAAKKTAMRINNFIHQVEAPLLAANIPMLVVNRQYETLTGFSGPGRELYGGQALKTKKAISIEMLKPRRKDGVTLRFDIRRNKTAPPYMRGEIHA